MITKLACLPALLIGIWICNCHFGNALKKSSFYRKRNRSNKDGSASQGDSGGLTRPWPWDNLNASEIEAKSYEYQIKASIMSDYQKASRPVLVDANAIKVYVGFSLFHILDTDEKYQTIQSLISIRLTWTDEYLQWDPLDFGNISKIWLSSNNIWLPDILISNYADDDYRDIIGTNAIINATGYVLWMYPLVTKTYCQLNVELFPFDHQTCNVTFFSWTFSGYQLDLHIDPSQKKINFYNPSGQEWFVDSITSDRDQKTYVCCGDEPFPEVTYTMHMRRRSLFYVVNLIFPCVLIYACALLGFFLPVESGEKVNLEITILLALVVFLIIAGEVLPPTPDAMPILGMLYGSSMLMVSLALVMCTIVTNLHFTNPKKLAKPVSQKIVRWSKLILCSTECICGQHTLDTASRTRCVCDTTEFDGTTGQAAWMLVSRAANRLFFWLFIFISLPIIIAMHAKVIALSKTDAFDKT